MKANAFRVHKEIERSKRHVDRPQLTAKFDHWRRHKKNLVGEEQAGVSASEMLSWTRTFDEMGGT
jgi:hypothetical protein